MRAEKYVFWFIFVFFLIVTPIYWFMAREIAGTFVLGFTGLLGCGGLALGEVVRDDHRRAGGRRQGREL